MTSPPDDQEMEISLFGPGLGECVVVHLGGGQWMIVDSCLDRHGRPVALEYLRSLDVGLESVRVIVASHFHHDHVAGLAQIVAQCRHADFCCSTALSKPDALALIAIYGGVSPRVAGTIEFMEVLKALKSEGRIIHWLSANQTVFRRHARPDVPGCAVTALAPSAAATDYALQVMASKIPRNGELRSSLVWHEPNVNAVVLWVKFGGVSILLGGDLEGTDEHLGWGAVVGSPLREPELADVFKVPHHGSRNAHSERVWDEMLVPQPVAAVATFHQGSAHLPTADMTRALCARTARAYATQSPDWRPPRAQQPTAVERSVREAGIVLRSRRGTTGHIRSRRARVEEPDQEWIVVLRDGAIQLTP